MSETLDARLAAAGIDDAKCDDPFETWRRLRAAAGRRATIVDLYALAGRTRELAPHELPLSERAVLATRALAVMYPGFETTSGSSRTEPVEIVPYDPTWPVVFERWRERLTQALGDVAVRVEHVGSTAVPGLDAKGVVDIQVSVHDLQSEERYVLPMEQLGLQLRSRDAEHRFLRPFADRPREVHVHVCAAGGWWEREHLLFRDYLRAHPQARDDYAVLKRAAAKTWRDDRIGYTEEKTALILNLLVAAEAWWRASELTVPDPVHDREGFSV